MDVTGRVSCETERFGMRGFETSGKWHFICSVISTFPYHMNFSRVILLFIY
jgi:hypothetical protein